MGFSNLHVHSTRGSLLDSIAKTEDIVKFASDNNQKALAITDHGSLASFIEQFKQCNKYGVKPIMGCEVYEVDDMNKKESTKDNREKRYHLILLAKNQTGHDNLIKIVSLAGTTGMYMRPRVDLKTIRENGWGDGIIACTACMAGRFSRIMEKADKEGGALDWVNPCREATNYYNELMDTFDDAYIELQSHGTKEQQNLNSIIITYINQNKMFDKYIITSDAHMVNESDRDIHRMFVATGQSREVGETYKDCYMQTEKDVRRIVGTHLSTKEINCALDNIDKLIDSIEPIDVGLNNETQMPQNKNVKNNVKYLRECIIEGLEEKERTGVIDKSKDRIYRDRLNMEFPIIKELEFIDYFIGMMNLIKEARKKEIPLGPGRGSAGGCLILYLIGVTQIDPIRWDLDFSRFANLGRKGAMADIDIDMSKNRRGEMIDIAKELFGKENVSPVSTFNTMTMKVALRDVGKVMNEQEDSPYNDKIPYDLRDSVAKIMPDILTQDRSGKAITKEKGFMNAIESNKELVKIYKQFPEWFKYALALDGLPKSRGKNASAVIISPKPIVSYGSLCLDKDGESMLECEMHNLMDDIGLVKYDFLGLKTLDVIDDTLKFAGKTWDDVDINHLNIHDTNVFDSIFKSGNTVGVFQMESAEAKSMCMKANASDIEDIVVVNSANRPGTKDQFPDYCDFKLNPEHVKVIHDDLREIFKQSHSVMMYQEQALALFRYAGFDETETDVGRRAIGKKKIEVMETLEPKFKSGLKDKGWTDEQANQTWELMVKQSGYSFNRSHAVAYSLLSYLTGYLKTYYPVQFMTSCLISADSNDKVSQFIAELNRMDIQICPPDINQSNDIFTPDKTERKIYYGLKDINSFKEGAYETILTLRPFTSFQDYITRTINDIDKTTHIMLIKAGAFSSITNASKVKQFKYLYKMRFNEGKEKLKKIKMVNKTHIKKMYDSGLITEEQKEDKEVCTVILNHQRLVDGWDDFEAKYLNGSELNWEMESLNTFVSGDPFEGVWLPDWSKININSKGHFGGTVTSCKVNKVKKGPSKGHSMAFINVETAYGIIDCVVFADKYKDYSNIITQGSTIVVNAIKQDELKAILSSVETLHDYLIRTSLLQTK